ncbi:acylphosphatase [Candidatus Uabimicrobium amorphum]|uniref:acylphosphatase n=1 Tax=Uabimicrobium amorphum TaxID=2596890 RepID=A0A5S9IQ96_UABAM|nr:acylphosphatase [Candidatus Uabimicrobium amorphum]BBM85727.1 acylphosphatase [Candidatus Uabimicrobium amorphum]
MKRLHVFVSGKVQGVSYRYYTTLEAAKYQISGWVRNLSDGRVEMLAEGSEEELQQLLNWTYKGSPAAEVSDVNYEWLECRNEFTNFTVTG